MVVTGGEMVVTGRELDLMVVTGEEMYSGAVVAPRDGGGWWTGSSEEETGCRPVELD